jgi:hypothetical protein
MGSQSPFGYLRHKSMVKWMNRSQIDNLTHEHENLGIKVQVISIKTCDIKLEI